ncbi:uncharacterized protein LOC109840022 [Asparagus officinalis]|uniref:uncharacterized protein LOC109840022 n=1 Tax=Asparagus officinalis TaxID=4686 RepID=UPI00098E6B4F|nr:uncharacterized protein LOC109840022 [Asparagus officinalis]
MTTSSSTTSPTSSSSSDLPTASPLPNFGNIHHFLSLKLTPTNYLLWKTQFLPLLRSFDLLGLVEGTDRCPSPSIVTSESGLSSLTPAYTAWVRKDQLLLSWIIASLSEEVLPQVVGLATSHEVWQALHQAFGSPSHTRILQLHTQLQNLQKGDSSVSSYLSKAKYLADELAAAGQPMPLATFNAIVFNTLAAEYGEMISALSARTEPVSYPELCSLLVGHEIRLSAQSVAVPSIVPAANVAHAQHALPNITNDNRFHRGRGRGRGRVSSNRRDPCPVCGKFCTISALICTY